MAFQARQSYSRCSAKHPTNSPELGAHRSQGSAQHTIAHAKLLADEALDTPICKAEQNRRVAEDYTGRIPSAVALECTMRGCHAGDTLPYPRFLHLAAMILEGLDLPVGGSSSFPSARRDRPVRRELPMGVLVVCESYGNSRS